MGRIQTGRPIDVPFGSGVNVSGQDFDERGTYIPDRTIIYRMLSDSIKTAVNNSRNGYYGRSYYGRCRYGTQPGIYGHDRYGAATYG